MSTQRSSVQRRLITPASWGKKDPRQQHLDAEQRTCSHCSHRGLRGETTIAGQMFRCPSCKKLQF
ncbi:MULTISPECIES: hypothetical protein [unclassified Paludibacterium]|uniref:hypothetical protein n=1 Tax=unclassified Paludibacterium TaxID=2618429 RepID=UPI001C03AF26|nr:hypothetical protein [Paludibacterium sp. B53371]BEV71329.1 hypothetical protein THUN1379_08110 [Paludibacterium sp. THUN1379]